MVRRAPELTVGFAVIAVAISAPVWISAPRPEKNSVKTQLVRTT